MNSSVRENKRRVQPRPRAWRNQSPPGSPLPLTTRRKRSRSRSRERASSSSSSSSYDSEDEQDFVDTTLRALSALSMTKNKPVNSEMNQLSQLLGLVSAVSRPTQSVVSKRGRILDLVPSLKSPSFTDFYFRSEQDRPRKYLGTVPFDAKRIDAIKTLFEHDFLLSWFEECCYDAAIAHGFKLAPEEWTRAEQVAFDKALDQFMKLPFR